MLQLDCLPIPIPWLPGASVVMDLGRAYDLTGAVYAEVMAAHIAEDTRIADARRALDPDAADAADQRAALDAAQDANNAAGFDTLAAHLNIRVSGITPVPVPGQPDTWAHVPDALKWWLANTALQEVRDQLKSPLASLRPTGSSAR